MIFSSMEHVIKWAHTTIGLPCSTEVQKNTPDEFLLVDRTGGEMDYPHDSPEYTISIWTRSSARSEQIAHELAIALKVAPPTDRNINAVFPPNVFSYGKQEGDFVVWQVTFSMSVNIKDERN